MIIYKLSEKDWWPREGGGVVEVHWTSNLRDFSYYICSNVLEQSSVFHSWGGRQVHVSAPGMHPSGKNWKVLGPKRFSELATDFSET